MIAVLFIFLSIWAGFILEERLGLFGNNLWAKLSCAVVTGILFPTWLIFAISFLTGFNKISCLTGMAILLLYIAIEMLASGKARSFLKNLADSDKSLRFNHIFLLLIVMPLFIFGVWEAKNGDIRFMGNYADLSYHISTITAFLEQGHFLPDNPQYAGAKLCYHFLIDFHSAILRMGGLGLLSSVVVPQVLLGFSFATLLYFFFKLLLQDEKKIFFASSFFIMGRIAFFNFVFAVLGNPAPGTSLNLHSFKSIDKQLLFPFNNFLDPIVNYLHPQRPFLMGLPLGLIILSSIYDRFLKKDDDTAGLFFLGTLIALTPLFHAHTFLVIIPIYLIFISMHLKGLKKIAVTLSPLLLAVPQICFIVSQPKAPGFSGFDVHTLGGALTNLNVFGSTVLTRLFFWIRAVGFPLILGTWGAVSYFAKNPIFDLDFAQGRKNSILLVFLSVFASFFILINFYRFSPNWGDSNKFFLYFYLLLSVFTASLLYSWFKRGITGKISAVSILLVAAILPWLLGTYHIFIENRGTLVTDCEKKVAEWIRSNTDKNSIFLTSDDSIHYLAPLSGRRVVNGSYTRETGFLEPETENDIRKIYKTADPLLIRKHKIDYILLGPQERAKYPVNGAALCRFPVVYDVDCRDSFYRIFSIHDTREWTQEDAARCSQIKFCESSRCFLSDLAPIYYHQDFGPLTLDSNISGEKLSIAGHQYDKGLGTHANSEITYPLDKKPAVFESDVGVDQSQRQCNGSVIFTVYADGKPVVKTPVMHWDSAPVHIKVPLVAVRELKLVVNDAGDGIKCDHADWANAAIYR